MAKKNPTNQYLSKLKPDPNFGHTLVGKYLTNVRLISLIIITIVAVGIVSFLTLPRRLNPEVKIPLVVVSTILPGASPNDIESLITIPIEEELESVQNVTSITSSSNNSVSVITAEFESNIEPSTARNRIQTAVDNVSDLPEDSLDPDITELDFENQPVWTFALTSSQDIASLMRFATRIQDMLEASSQIKEVQISGLDQQEIQIIIDSNKAASLGLDPIRLSSSISNSLASFPAGEVISDANTFTVSIDPQIQSVEQLRSVPININGQVLSLQDIATISFNSEPNQPPSFITNETGVRQSVTMSVFKTSAADINTAQETAQVIVQENLSGHEQFEVIDITNTSEEIDEQFNELASNFASTIILVFVTLLIFLGLRQALVASISIPLTFLIAFTIMQLIGISLNFLSLFSLLLALGLVVDDAIVIISAMTSYYKTGRFSAQDTGFLVWKDFIVPIWSTTITTVWAFIPLLLASGIIGEFIKSIPVVVTATLLSSTTVAVLINLPLMIILLHSKVARRVKVSAAIILILISLILFNSIIPSSPLSIPTVLAFIILLLFLRSFGRLVWEKIAQVRQFQKITSSTRLEQIKNGFKNGFISTNALEIRYQKIVSKILQSSKNRKLTIAAVVTVAIFSFALLPLGFVQNEFFPKTNADILFLEAQAPSGSNLNTLIQESQIVSSTFLANNDDIAYYATQIGSRADGFDSSSQNNNYILYTLNLVDDSQRSQSSIELANQLRSQTASYSGISKLSVIEQSGGPPVGADLQIILLGPELEILTQKATQVSEYLNTVNGVDNIDISIKPGISKLTFNPDYQQLASNQISIDSIGLSLRNFVSGFTYDDIIINGETYDIIYRSDANLQSIDSINQLSIIDSQETIPLSTLGSFELRPNPTTITREDGQRTITISAAVTGSNPAPVINQGLEEFAQNQLQLPAGYSWKTGGVNQENESSVQSILQAMLVAALLILITMVVQLQSFRKAFIVLLVIPLATSGVFIIFALSGTPLSFPALIGVLALFGIVVNNSIMLTEKINQNLSFGLKLKDAVVDASTSRLEPIMLSSLTTIMGLLPITISDPLWRGLGGAIIAGLSFSGIIMLFFIPTVYYAIYQKEVK